MVEFRDERDNLLDYYDAGYIKILPRVGEKVQLSPEGSYVVTSVIHIFRVSPLKTVVFCKRIDAAIK